MLLLLLANFMSFYSFASSPEFSRICEKYNDRKERERHEKRRDKRTKVNGVFREFSIPFIVSVRPFVAATSHGKKAGADPRTQGRLPANFSKARATAVAIIPNEKVTAAARGTAVQADRCCSLYFTPASRRNLFSWYHETHVSSALSAKLII